MRKEQSFICVYSPPRDTQVRDSQLGAGNTDAVLIFEALMMQREARLWGRDSG